MTDIVIDDDNPAVKSNRIDGSKTPPIITNVVGNGSEYTQSWKVGAGPNWIDRAPGVPKSNALGAFFKRKGK